MPTHVKKISVIIPVFNEKENIAVLLERLRHVGETIRPWELEILFVDDASSDGSFEAISEQTLRDSRIRVLRLSRNFGSHRACLAGLTYSTGNKAVLISADLQDPPE